MTIPAEELRTIVVQAGGIEPFAEMIDATPRAVRSWISGQRTMSATTAKLIRILLAAKLTLGLYPRGRRLSRGPSGYAYS